MTYVHLVGVPLSLMDYGTMTSLPSFHFARNPKLGHEYLALLLLLFQSYATHVFREEISSIFVQYCRMHPTLLALR